MINELFEHVGVEHTCSFCNGEYTEDDGGTTGYFSGLPVAFCPGCLSGVLDMAEQYNDAPTADRYFNTGGLLSRMGGPAVEWSDGDVEYWVDGVRYTEDDYQLLHFISGNPQ